MKDNSTQRFEQLIADNVETIYAVARRFVESESAAQTLTRDAIVEALDSRAELDDEARVKPWLLKILRDHFVRKYQHRSTPSAVILLPSCGSMMSRELSSA